MGAHQDGELDTALLRARMVWYKDQCSRLQSEKDALHSSAGEESTNLRDIIEYLGRELSARELEVSELKSLQATLEARLKDSQSEAQACAEQYERYRSEADAEHLTRLKLLERRLQDAGSLFKQNELLTVERNALKAALTEERTLNQKRLGDLENKHVHERDVWEQKADAQMRSAVSAAEQAVKINGISKGDIDAELQYQAQQIDFMYDSMKDAKSKMAAMRRELEVSRELGGRLTAQNQALQHALNVLAERLKAQSATDGAQETHVCPTHHGARQVPKTISHAQTSACLKTPLDQKVQKAYVGRTKRPTKVRKACETISDTNYMHGAIRHRPNRILPSEQLNLARGKMDLTAAELQPMATYPS